MTGSLALLLAAGLALAAQPEKAPTTPPPNNTAPAHSHPHPHTTPTTPPTPAAQPQVPAMPKAIPVPDGPVVKRQELEGGLIAEDLTIGTGYDIAPGGAVVALYHGTLKEGGAEFDSAFKRGEPMAFSLNGVVKGWSQGLPGMKVGGVRRLTVPAALGYGAQGNGPGIPPNSDLVFVVQITDSLRFEDIKVGTGEAAASQCVPVTAYTMKADGKDIETRDAANPYIWLPGEIMAPPLNFDPLQTALTGMKVGGKRKVYIPKEMNYAPPQLPVSRPQGVALELEVDLIAVRNLPGAQR